jgi:hypothetical protein
MAQILIRLAKRIPIVGLLPKDAWPPETSLIWTNLYIQYLNITLFHLIVESIISSFDYNTYHRNNGLFSTHCSSEAQ